MTNTKVAVPKSKVPTSNLIEVTSKSAVENANNHLVESLLAKLEVKNAEIVELNKDKASLRVSNNDMANKLDDIKENGKKVFIYNVKGLSFEGDNAVKKITAEVTEAVEKKFEKELKEGKEERVKLDAENDKLKLKLKETEARAEVMRSRDALIHDDNKRALERDYNEWKRSYNKKMASLKEELNNLKEKGIAVTAEKELNFYREKAKTFLGRLFLPKFEAGMA